MTWAEPAWAWLFLLALPAVGLAWRSTRIKRQYLEILTGRGSQATRADQVAFVGHQLGVYQQQIRQAPTASGERRAGPGR